MVNLHYPFLLCFLLVALFSFGSEARVPANETFVIVNEGEFGDRIIEYDANYRPIRNDVYNFFTFPFALYFYNTTPNAYIFAMRADRADDGGDMRWVWDANRNDPVRENATLSFGREGNLVLADVDGRVVWQTNTANKGVTSIKLLGNGNLVLLNNKGNYVWQSFDYPTDILLAGQSLKINGRNKLVSRKSDIDSSDGPYSLVLDHTGFTMFLNYSGQQLTYGGWRDITAATITFNVVPLGPYRERNTTAYELVLNIYQDVSSSPPPMKGRRRLLQVRPIGNSHLLNLNQVSFNATFSYLKLGSDGNLKAYTYDPTVEYLRWSESFAFFSDYFVRECALPSKCGSFGVCTKGMCVGCPSPKGVLGWSESCAPPKLKTCRNGNKYYKVVGVEHFLNPYLDDGEGPMKVEECRTKCDKDCKCLGFIYKEDTSKCLLAPVLATLIKTVNATSVGYIKY